MKKLFFLLFYFWVSYTMGQSVHGIILGKSPSGLESPLPGAALHWIGTGKGTISDDEGKFHLSGEGISDYRMIVTYTGYKPDTLMKPGNHFIRIILSENISLKAAVVESDRENLAALESRKTEIIGAKDLKKAACCNLGESFETNATVDITLKDALSGSKEIQILGLSGAYTQILTENAPVITNLGLTYGLNTIPGTQIEAINIVKGPGSVIFGHESISGMINVELKDPAKAEKLFLNLYSDLNNRHEINLDLAKKGKKGFSSLLSLHGDYASTKQDMNRDGFRDMPVLGTFIGMQKIKYQKGNLVSVNHVRYVFEDRRTGQTSFDFNRDDSDSLLYGQFLKTHKGEFSGRTGIILPSTHYSSLGIQYTGVIHEQSGKFGLRDYRGNQNTLDIRIIWNSNVLPKHSLNAGLNFRHNETHERFDTFRFNKLENIPGVFIEDTYSPGKKTIWVIGLRGDYLGKVYLTPRVNVKRTIFPKTDLRLSAGTGWRTSSILAENPGILSSQRIILQPQPLKPESAFNFGADLTRTFELFYRPGTITLDAYRTEFTNKIIPDFESDSTSRHVVFRNLEGMAYSNTIQIQAEHEIIKNLSLKLSFKYLDVFSKLGNNRIVQPFISKYRSAVFLHYQTFNRKWTFSTSVNWFSSKRLPNTQNNPLNLRFAENSTPYFILNGQLNRIFKNLELYLGAENLLGFKQGSSIIDAGYPGSPYFDTNYVWAPMDGRRIYGGLRFKIK